MKYIFTFALLLIFLISLVSFSAFSQSIIWEVKQPNKPKLVEEQKAVVKHFFNPDFTLEEDKLDGLTNTLFYKRWSLPSRTVSKESYLVKYIFLYAKHLRTFNMQLEEDKLGVEGNR